MALDTAAGRKQFYDRIITYKGASWDKIRENFVHKSKERLGITEVDAKTVYKSTVRQIYSQITPHCDKDLVPDLTKRQHAFVVLREYVNAITSRKCVNKRHLCSIATLSQDTDAELFKEVASRVGSVVTKLRAAEKAKCETKPAEPATPTKPRDFNDIIPGTPRPPGLSQLKALLGDKNATVRVRFKPQRGENSKPAVFLARCGASVAPRFDMPCNRSGNKVCNLASQLRARWAREGKANKEGGIQIISLLDSLSIQIFPRIGSAPFEEKDGISIADVIVSHDLGRLEHSLDGGAVHHVTLYYDLSPEPDVDLPRTPALPAADQLRAYSMTVVPR
ncbi:hypothetical protein J8273_0118 [Carpediemonas membranifera]|uniref:Uncharacterized protein n=1 Tax=Carpediemonas membranifera TaxID=201153 RepID=A0A8J6BYV4_9EUKA|nr:hypothetical protein J8273_0118 [Carpediemonas membranifera]|eukprot:KAG9394911.1 hypothetical protein J8273_0118 [Carpediemonas membranifera]